MKKVLAILLASLMLLTIVPFAAFAKLDKDDAVIAEIKNPNAYKHIEYVKDKNEFKADRIAMGIFATYDDAWVNAFTDNVDVNYAEGLLLTLIEKIEAEYNNETFEKVLGVLSGVQKGMEIVDKIDSYTNVLDLAENSNWGTALTVISDVVKIANLANDTYEKYVEAYAKVLSIQAASIYYSEFLDYIIENVSGDHEETIQKAAQNIKATMAESLEEARDQILADLATDAAKQGAYMGISAAMKTNTVTAVIDTVYNLSGTIGNKVFDTQNLYQYMTSLAEIVEIEDCMPAYVDAAEGRNLMPKLKDEELTEEEVETKEEVDDIAWSFAINALLTLHECGEGLLKKLADTKSSSVWNSIGSAIKLWSNTEEMNALIKAGAVSCAKLGAYRKLLAADGNYKTYAVWTSTELGKNAIVYNANGQIIGKIISATQTESISDEVALFAELDEDLGTYIKVIIPLTDGLYATYPNYTVGSGNNGSNGGSSGGSSGGFSFGSIFSNLFASLSSFFSNLFSFFKF